MDWRLALPAVLVSFACSDSRAAVWPDARPPECSSDEAKRVFVTRGEYTPDFGEVWRADALCQEEADRSSLGGVWVAWLSGGLNRLACDGPWVDRRGTLIFPDRASLTVGPSAPLTTDADGTPLAGDSYTIAWTGTDRMGRLSADCRGWRDATAGHYGTVGSPFDTTFGWTQYGDELCYRRAHLYCFEQ